jgi:hypothetical protein
MGLENVKVLYATAPRGLRVSIPLIQAGAYNVADITERLKNAGVRDDELPYVVFSGAASPPHPTRPGPADAAAAFTSAAPTVAPPAIPVPTLPNTAPPLFSEFAMVSIPQAVTPSWRQLTGCRYSMKRADNQGYVVVQDLPQSAFQNPDDFDRINSGRIRLCYGLIWRQAFSPQFLRHGDRWDQKIETTHGMSTTNSFSITASVGYSGYGASASISATYGYSVTVDDQTKVTNEVSVDGQPGESQTAVLWELCRKYVIEVDGVLRDESNPFTVVFLDKGGPHQLQDSWGPMYEVISHQATLLPTIFKDAPGVALS